jgi:hypothetical protein
MSLQLNHLKNKTIGPHPQGPGSTSPHSKRPAKFRAGTGFGLSKNKKGKAGARAGLGQKGRKPRISRGVTLGHGTSPPSGPGQSLNPGAGSVRLPNRTPSAPKAKPGGFFGRFFKRARAT